MKLPALLFPTAFLMLCFTTPSPKKFYSKQHGAGDSAAAMNITVSVNNNHLSDVNNYMFGMMTENYLEKWNTGDPKFIELVKKLGVTQFQYPGGSISYWWHYSANAKGYGFKEGEYTGFRHGASYASDENYFQKFIKLCKATNAKAVICANILTGTTDELDGALSELGRQGVPVMSVILGVELHLEAVRDRIDIKEYLKRAASAINMVHSKHPGIKIYANGAPVDRGQKGGTYQEWNQKAGAMQGIDGMVQYEWWRPEYSGNGLTDLKNFMASLDTYNSALKQYSPHWDIDQWGIKEEAKPVYAGTMLQFIHICWYLLYVTDYNYKNPGFYQSLEYMKLGSSYVQDLMNLKVHKNPGSGYTMNPAYYAFELMSSIKNAKYAPATVSGSSDVKAYYFEKEGKKYLFLINLTNTTGSLDKATINNTSLKANMVKTYWSSNLNAGMSGIQSSASGGNTINPNSVTLFSLQ